MKKISRRDIVKVGVGLIAFWPAAQELASSKASHAQSMLAQQDPANYFVAGRISGVKGRDLFFVDERSVVNRVTITSGTEFWRGASGAPLSQVKIGDFMYARGVLDGTTLTAKSAWVNIVNLTGDVSHVGSGDLLFKTNGYELELVLQKSSECFIAGKQQPSLSIPNNTRMQVVGLWDERANRVTATRIFLPDTSGRRLLPESEIAPEIQEQDNDATSPTSPLSRPVRGCSSWFCCGNAYGPCGPAGGGACGDCQSSAYHCAWPNMNHYGYPCNYVGCGEYNQLLYCGNTIHVRNPCNGAVIQVAVHDCGPNEPMFCGNRAPDCSPSHFYDRVIDLTPAAFSALAPLSQGLVSAKCF